MGRSNQRGRLTFCKQWRKIRFGPAKNCRLAFESFCVIFQADRILFPQSATREEFMFSTPYIAGKTLSSAVLTNNMQLAMKFALELEAGIVHLNGPTVHDEATVPFGGVKDSGMGREGGRWSIEEMTEVKWVTIQIGKRPYPF